MSKAADSDGSDSDCQIVSCQVSPPKPQPRRQSSLFDFFGFKGGGGGSGSRISDQATKSQSSSKSSVKKQQQQQQQKENHHRKRSLEFDDLDHFVAGGCIEQRRKAEAEAEAKAEAEGAVQKEDEEADDEAPDAGEQPYYARWFAHIVSTVSQDSELEFLFSTEQRQQLAAVARLPPERPELRLLARLLCRTLRFHRPARLRYPELGVPPEQAFVGLASLGLAESLAEASPPPSLAELLSLCSCPELIDVAKRLGGGIASGLVGAGRRRDGLTRSLLRASANSLSAGAFRAEPRPAAACRVRRAVLAAIGPAWRLRPAAADLLEAAFLAFHIELHDTEATNVFQDLLFRLRRIELGAEPEPLPAELVRDKPATYRRLYPDPAALQAYLEAVRFERRLRDLQQRRQFLQLEDAYTESGWTAWLEQAISGDDGGSLAKLADRVPVHLRRFTELGALFRAADMRAAALERLRRYPEAARQYQLLLSQQVLLTRSRYRRHLRLALLLDRHQRDPAASLAAISRALAEPGLCPAARRELAQRAASLAARSSDTIVACPLVAAALLEQPPKPPARVEISGATVSHWLPGRVNVFLDGGSGDASVCSVETVALDHYRSTAGGGYTRGLHAEGSPFHSLFFLLQREAVFAPLPGAFLSRYQRRAPLDLRYPAEFLAADGRQVALDAGLQRLLGDECREAGRLEAWIRREAEQDPGLLFSDRVSLDDLCSLAEALPRPLLAGILAELGQNYDQLHAGMPDLLLWCPASRRCLFAEVKGPGDQLSAKQTLWLARLRRLGASAEVCLVRAEQGGLTRRRLTRDDPPPPQMRPAEAKEEAMAEAEAEPVSRAKRLRRRTDADYR